MCLLGIGRIRTSLNITSEPVISNISPRVSSIYGGAILKIIGNGFPRTNASVIHVMVGSNPCLVIRSTSIRLECIIPAQGNNSDMTNISVFSDTTIFSSSFSLNYSIIITPLVTAVNSTTVNNSRVLYIIGNHFIPGNTSVSVGDSLCFINSLNSTFITCTIGSDLGTGQHSVVVFVDEVGNSNSDVFYTQNLLLSHISPVKGSYGGGLPVTIFGQGFNTTNIGATVCNRPCASVTVVSNTQLICVTPNVSMNEVNDTCNLTVTIGNISVYALFTYESNLTATVTSLSPIRGGTGGGTILTILGVNFA